MAPCHFLFACFLACLAGCGCNAQCTEEEVNKILACVAPYTDALVDTFGTTAHTCDRSLFSSQICSYYKNIVICINQADLSPTTCRPKMVRQMNARIEIPCRIQDFEDTCTGAPAIDQGGKGGSVVHSVTTPLLIACAVFTAVIVKFDVMN